MCELVQRVESVESMLKIMAETAIEKEEAQVLTKLHHVGGLTTKIVDPLNSAVHPVSPVMFQPTFAQVPPGLRASPT